MLVIFTVFFISAFAFSFRSATVPKQTDSGQKSLIGAGVFRAYSVLSAITGSFFAAFFAGSRPPRMVITMLMAIRMIDDCNGSCAVRSVRPDTFSMITLIGNSASSDTPIPSSSAPAADDKGFGVEHL